MSSIDQSAKQISQIIGVIDEIAFQTNLLALNAGVEAARAGEDGRGFAVVASEVRLLAQRSAEAAKEIKSLITTSVRQVERGVELVGDTGRALQAIVDKVSDVHSIVGAIAVASQEQATGIAEVNSAVGQMDQVTQQNAAMVEQSTAATHALAQEIGQLDELAAGFRLGAGAVAAKTLGAGSVAAKSATPRSAPSKPLPSKPVMARQTQAAHAKADGTPAKVAAKTPLRVVNGQVHKSGADDWEEF